MIKNNEIVVEWPRWSQIINHKFLTLVNNKDYFLLLWGGRGSSKSRFVATKLIYECLTEEHFRCVMVRKYYNSIQGSCFQNIKDIVNDLGLNELFDFTTSPLKITCKNNGNFFIGLGCDDVSKIKSVSDISKLWIEEDIIDQDDFNVISSSIRTKKARTQILMSINPEVEESNFEDNWMFKMFFKAKYPNELSFSGHFDIKLGDKPIKLSYTTHHSTYKDNRFLTDEYRASLENLKNIDEYRYEVYTLGKWGNRKAGGLFYPTFTIAKHTGSFAYDQDKPLHVAVDFNANPGNATTIWQLNGKEITCISSFFAKSDQGNTKEVATQLLQRYGHIHNSSMIIYGDASAKHEDTRQESGWNDYKILQRDLKDRFNPKFEIPEKNPGVEVRGEWINQIFANNLDDIKINIDINNAKELINDLQLTKMDSDRTKLKEKIKKDGVSQEKTAHMNDTMDYILCKVFEKEFNAYRKGRRYISTTPEEAFYQPVVSKRIDMGY